MIIWHLAFKVHIDLVLKHFKQTEYITEHQKERIEEIKLYILKFIEKPRRIRGVQKVAILKLGQYTLRALGEIKSWSPQKS